LVDEALKRLGYGERKSRRLHTRLRPTTFGSALFSGVTEVLRHEHSGRDKVRSVVLVDEVRGHGRRLGSLRMARTLVDAGFDAMAVLPSGVWAPKAMRERLLRAIEPHHPTDD